MAVSLARAVKLINRLRQHADFESRQGRLAVASDLRQAANILREIFMPHIRAEADMEAVSELPADVKAEIRRAGREEREERRAGA